MGHSSVELRVGQTQDPVPDLMPGSVLPVGRVRVEIDAGEVQIEVDSDFP